MSDNQIISLETQILFYLLNLTVELLNRAQKKLAAIGAWENSKTAQLEAELKKIEVTITSFKF